MSKLKRRELSPKFFGILGVFLFIIFLFGYLIFGLNYKNAHAAVDPPAIITYQGKLTESGTLVTTTKSMTFELFTVSSGGTAFYSTTTNITPSQGLFTVDLTPSASSFADSASVYLEVTIGGTETLSPRKQITASPYAFNSRYLSGYGVNTVSSSEYIPRSDSSGNFTFNSTTITTSTISNLTVGNSLSLPSDVISSTHLQSTSVTTGTYGSATQVSSFTVDSDGRLTYVTSTLISITSNQVSGSFSHS